MRVTLVNPALTYSRWNADITRPGPESLFIKLGLAYLSACLKERGHEVHLIDLRMIGGWEEYDRLLGEQNPQILGVTMYTVEWKYGIECCRRAKEVLPGITTVMGGIHATMFPEECLKTGVVDHVARGEWETTFVDFVENPRRFPTSLYGSTPDLDALPFPDRELWSDYAERTRTDPWGLRNYRFPLPTTEMIAIRGCPFKCTFCCGPGEQQLFTKPGRIATERVAAIRSSGIERTMREIDHLVRRYDIRSITFHDDQFIIKPAWVDEFCKAMQEWGFVDRGIEWLASCRSDLICRHSALVEKMAEAGLRIIIIGFESFSQRVLDWFKKGTTVEENREAALICKRNGIKIWANYILGIPGPWGWDFEDDRATVEGVQEIEPDHYSPSFFTPMPGSPIYSWCVENEVILHCEDPSSMGGRDPGKARIRGINYDRLQSIMVHDGCFAKAKVG